MAEGYTTAAERSTFMMTNALPENGGEDDTLPEVSRVFRRPGPRVETSAIEALLRKEMPSAAAALAAGKRPSAAVDRVSRASVRPSLFQSPRRPVSVTPSADREALAKLAVLPFPRTFRQESPRVAERPQTQRANALSGPGGQQMSPRVEPAALHRRRRSAEQLEAALACVTGRLELSGSPGGGAGKGPASRRPHASPAFVPRPAQGSAGCARPQSAAVHSPTRRTAAGPHRPPTAPPKRIVVPTAQLSTPRRGPRALSSRRAAPAV